MEVAILLFDRLTALDAIGPYEVLSRIPNATVKFVAKDAGAKRTDVGSLALVADYALNQIPTPDIFVVPGWMAHTHQAKSDSVLFSFSDRPVQKAMGLWREQAPA